MELMDMPLDEFMASLPELEQMGYNRDELIRMYRAQNSPMAPVNAAAAASAQEIADAGRRPVAGGLFSKESGTTGWDALSSLNFEGWNGLTQAGAGIGQAIDAPMAAAQGLIPQGDMALEALGTAGAAMTGGGAAVVPDGSLRANAMRGYHGSGNRNIDQFRVKRGRRGDIYDPAFFAIDEPGTDALSYANSYNFDRATGVDGAGRTYAVDIPQNDLILDARIAAERQKLIAALDNYDGIGEGGAQFLENQSQRGSQLPGWGDDRLYRALDEAGYKGVVLQERPPEYTGGPGGVISAAVFDPDTVRMRDTLAANADTSGGLLATTASDTLTPSQQMARRILDMRAAGRAGEVTDDMMAQADPQVMFNETPLPMDVDSRDARRLAAGFNTGAFHGGRGGYDRLDPEMADGKTYETGTWAADDPDISATYNGSVFDGTQATYPLRLRTQNYGVTDWENNAWGDGNPQARMLNPNEPRPQKFGDIYEDWQSWASTDNAARAANEQGLDGLRINNVVDIGPNIFSRANKTRPLPETGTSFSITNPTTARSDFARFDPEFAHLSNLSAANADYLTGLVASGASDEEVQAAYQMILDLEGPR